MEQNVTENVVVNVEIKTKVAERYEKYCGKGRDQILGSRALKRMLW